MRMVGAAGRVGVRYTGMKGEEAVLTRGALSLGRPPPPPRHSEKGGDSIPPAQALCLPTHLL